MIALGINACPYYLPKLFQLIIERLYFEDVKPVDIALCGGKFKSNLATFPTLIQEGRFSEQLEYNLMKEVFNHVSIKYTYACAK